MGWRVSGVVADEVGFGESERIVGWGVGKGGRGSRLSVDRWRDTRRIPALPKYRSTYTL